MFYFVDFASTEPKVVNLACFVLILHGLRVALLRVQSVCLRVLFAWKMVWRESTQTARMFASKFFFGEASALNQSSQARPSFEARSKHSRSMLTAKHARDNSHDCCIRAANLIYIHDRIHDVSISEFFLGHEGSAHGRLSTC
jgi:hypothetical protein